MGRNASAETDVSLRAEILSYSRARGLFAGISLAGSTLRPDNDANKKLYGKEVSAKDIVFNKAVAAPKSASVLLATLRKRSPKNLAKSSEAGRFATLLEGNAGPTLKQKVLLSSVRPCLAFLPDFAFRQSWPAAWFAFSGFRTG